MKLSELFCKVLTSRDIFPISRKLIRISSVFPLMGVAFEYDFSMINVTENKLGL
jgi:hypothetical protein